MKKFIYLPLALVLSTGVFSACNSKKTETTTTTNVDTTTSTAPVQISSDDSLTTGVRDATKDFPGVTASVDNGEVTLTGKIKRDRLPTLMQSIHSLHPKKVNNNLTVENKED
ncbi:MAG: BON domain-containing protein [Flavisolibacter sp.]